MGLWSIVGGAIGSIIEPGGGTVIGGALGSAIDSGTANSNTGNAGFDSYIKNTKRTGPWPDVTTLINALQAAGDKDTGLLNAIRSTYNQTDGTAQYGDWRIAVTSTAPITIEQFKGATETGITRTQASLASFAAGSAAATPIAQPNIATGPATDAVFPPVKQGTVQITSDGKVNYIPPQQTTNTTTPPATSGVPVWAWIVGGVFAFIVTIGGLIFALKPSRR